MNKIAIKPTSCLLFNDRYIVTKDHQVYLVDRDLEKLKFYGDRWDRALLEETFGMSADTEMEISLKKM